MPLMIPAAVGLMLIINVLLFGPIGATIWAVQMIWIPVTAAGIINGIGQVGAVLQELLIGSLYKSSGGRLGPILTVLMASAALAVLTLAVILWRNARGLSDV